VRTVPAQIKKRLRHWTIALSVDLVAIEAAEVLGQMALEVAARSGQQGADDGFRSSWLLIYPYRHDAAVTDALNNERGEARAGAYTEMLGAEGEA
jgi:hypothetical protein